MSADRGGARGEPLTLPAEEDLRVWAVVARVAQALLAAGLDESDLLTYLCAKTVEEMGCDASHIFLWQEEEQGFVAAAHVGEDPEVWGLTRLFETPPAALGEILTRLRRDGMALVSYRTSTTPASTLAGTPAAELNLSPRLVAMARRAGWQCCLFIAITRGERVVGFQTACTRDPQADFSPAQLRLARHLSIVASYAARCASLAQSLERASRLQSQFVASMSHELRTPLNVIMGYNALLLEEEYGPLGETQRDILARVEARSRDLFDLIRSTLDVGRLESGRMPFEWRSVDAETLMAEVKGDTRHLQTRADVRFGWHCEEPLPALYTDPAKLRVVLSNLIANAAKFTDRGEVNVVARATNDAFQFVVSDTGVGIAPEMLPGIFEPFRKGGGEGDRRPGVGLGLYIVRSLVERLDGKVLVESHLGRGSRFVVQLPLQRVVEEE